MSFPPWPVKDPDERLDYSITWAAELLQAGSDTIATSTWTISGVGLTTDEDEVTGNVVTVWLVGGTLGAAYTINNHIVTAGGREYDQTMSLKIKAK